MAPQHASQRLPVVQAASYELTLRVVTFMEGVTAAVERGVSAWAVFDECMSSQIGVCQKMGSPRPFRPGFEIRSCPFCDANCAAPFKQIHRPPVHVCTACSKRCARRGLGSWNNIALARAALCIHYPLTDSHAQGKGWRPHN